MKDLPNVDHDKTLSSILGQPGPEKMVQLSIEASENVREYLSQWMHKETLNALRFETLILPFMFEARRIGEARGVAREHEPVSALFPEGMENV